MEIKSRAFPHPVLGPDSDDFTAGSLRLIDARAEAAPELYRITFSVEINHPDFSEMLQDGAAAAGVVVECRQNLYRVRHPVQVGVNTLELKADELRGEVHITPVISAAKLIANYRPRFLNGDYDGLTLKVPDCGLLAHGPNLVFQAEPRPDMLRNISSILRVKQTEGLGRSMRVNSGGERILVEVSPEMFAYYQNVAGSREATAILASMLVLPVLVDVLHGIKAEGEEGWKELEARRWFCCVRSRLQQVGHALGSHDFDPISAAQALLDSPFARGIAELIERLDLTEST
jgi:hypothetical protein